MSNKYDPQEYQIFIRTAFQNKTDLELVDSFNCQVGSPGLAHARFIHLQELRCEFERRNWNYSVITNSSGGFNLSKGNQVYLKGLELLLAHQQVLDDI